MHALHLFLNTKADLYPSETHNRRTLFYCTFPDLHKCCFLISACLPRTTSAEVQETLWTCFNPRKSFLLLTTLDPNGAKTKNRKKQNKTKNSIHLLAGKPSHWSVCKLARKLFSFGSTMYSYHRELSKATERTISQLNLLEKVKFLGKHKHKD